MALPTPGVTPNWGEVLNAHLTSGQDADIAAYVNDPASQVRAALSATYALVAHGHAQLITAGQMAVFGGSPTLSGNGPSWWLDSANDESVSGAVNIPSTFTAVHVDAIWYNPGAGTGDVAWRCDYLGLEGSNIESTITVGPDVTVAVGTGKAPMMTRLMSDVALVDHLAWFKVRRRGNLAADTLPNDCGLVALLITKAS